MSDIAATSLFGARLSGGILALKQQLQQEAAVTHLVEKAVESARKAAEPAPASDRLVDIVV